MACTNEVVRYGLSCNHTLSYGLPTQTLINSSFPANINSLGSTYTSIPANSNLNFFTILAFLGAFYKRSPVFHSSITQNVTHLHSSNLSVIVNTDSGKNYRFPPNHAHHPSSSDKHNTHENSENSHPKAPNHIHSRNFNLRNPTYTHDKHSIAMSVQLYTLASTLPLPHISLPCLMLMLMLLVLVLTTATICRGANEDSKILLAKLQYTSGTQDQPEAPEKANRTPNTSGSGTESWVRPLSSVGEVVSAAGLLCGTFNMAQVLWLASPTPLTPALVRRALTIVARRVMVLQLCVEWRGLWPWYKRLTRVMVDLSVVHGDPVTVCQQQVRLGYSAARRPLWRATLVPLPPSQSRETPKLYENLDTKENLESEENLNCKDDVKLKENTDGGSMKYRAALILTIHHAVTDGTTNMIISRDILQVLNSIVMGREHQTPIRNLVPPLKQRALVNRDWLHTLRFILSASRTAFINAFQKESLLRHLPQPRTRVALTKVLQHDFSSDATEKLLKWCKMTGVSVDSCIMTAANIALFHIVQNYSHEKLEFLKIVQERAVNIRRYYSSDHREAVGSVAFIDVQSHNLSNAVEDQFWMLAKQMQDRLYRNLEVKRTPLKTTSLSWICAGLIPLNCVLTKLGCTNFIFSHINSTNMGNLQHLLPAKYDHGPVEITGVLRTNASEYAGSLCTVTCQTFDGRLLTSLDYYTHRMTEDVASEFFSEFARCVQEVAQRGTLGSSISQNGSLKSRGSAEYRSPASTSVHKGQLSRTV